MASSALSRQWGNRLHGGAAVALPHRFGALSHDDDKNERNNNNNNPLRGLPQIRPYHSTAAQDRAVAIMLGLGTIAAVSYSAAQGVKAYNEFKESWPEQVPEEKGEAQENTTKAEDQEKQQEAKKEASAKSSKQGAKAKRENIFKEWFGVGVGAKYYEGGFEETMTRREAALILGMCIVDQCHKKEICFGF